MLPLVTTVKVIPLLDIPPTVTTTGPVAAPDGAGATILLSFQLLGVAVTPLKVTVLVPWVAPKLEPLMVTKVPIDPEAGDRAVISGDGGAVTLKTELVAWVSPVDETVRMYPVAD